VQDIQIQGVPVISAPQNTTAHCTDYTYTPGFTFNNAGSTITSYSWSVSNNSGVTITNDTGPTPTITFTLPGTYTVTGTATNSCGSSSQSQTITIITTPTVTINPVTSQCVPFNVQPQVQINNGGSALLPTNGLGWVLSGGVANGIGFVAPSNSTNLNPNLSITIPGVYTATLTAQNVCGSGSSSIQITAQGVPTVTLPNTELCYNQVFDPVPTILDNNSPITGYQWTINPGSQTSSNLNATFNLGPGSNINYDYSLTATNACGSTTADGDVFLIAAPTVTIPQNTITNCLANWVLDLNPTFDNGGGVIQGYNWNIVGGTQNVDWSIQSGALNSADANFTFLNSGNYSLIVELESQCGISSDQVQLVIQDVPEVTIPNVLPECEPLQVVLNPVVSDNLSAITSYNWTTSPLPNTVQFVNGTSNLSETTEILFADNNTYTLQLAVTNGCGITTDTQQVVVHDTPIANVAGGIICPGGTLPLNVLPSGGSGSGFTYSWTPTNGLNYSVGQNVAASPISTQIYSVEISDSNGCNSATDVTVTVQPDPIVIVNDVNICAGNSVSLSASGATNYSWSPSTGLNQINGNPVISTPGSSITYTVTGTDPYPGCVGTAQLTVNVTDIVVDAGVDFEVCDQSAVIQLGGSPSGGVWSGVNVANGQFIPNGPGVYNLTYTYTVNPPGLPGGCAFMDEVQVTVNQLPSATVTPDLVICPGIQTTLVGTALNGEAPYNVSWLLGGNVLQTSNSTNPLNLNVSPVNTTTYNFEVVDNNGCEATNQVTVTTWEQPVAVSSPDVTICSDQTTTLVGQGTLGLAPYTFNWYVQGNALSIGNAPTLFVDEDVTTNFIFEIVDGHGCVSTDLTTVTVNPTPLANFQVISNLTNVSCINVPIAISNLSQGADTYEWYYDGTLVSNDQNPNIVPTAMGMHQIGLIVENNFGCDDTLYLDIEIIAPPTSSFTAAYDPTGCGPLDVTFDNTSTGLYVNYTWEFSSNDLIPNISNVAEPGVYTYLPGPDIITYIPTLTVENICGTAFYSEEIIVNPIPIPSFTLSQNVVCYPFPLDFNNTSLGNPDVYQWDMGDGSPIITIDATSPITNPQGYIYGLVDQVTTYTITLTATNECGTVSSTQTVTVLPDVINAFVTADVVSGCSPLIVSFDGLGVGATDFSYDFGDGAVAGTEDAIHIFNATQYPSEIFTVQFSATNGCADDQVTLQIVVYPTPDGTIVMDDLGLCPTEMVNVSADVEDPYIQNYTWTINALDPNGNVTGLENDLFLENLNNVSVFDYVSSTVPGLYQTQLDLVSINGCVNTLTQNFEVYENPIAIATSALGSTPIICPESSVWLQGNAQQSSGAQPYSYTWFDLTNGVTSNQQFFEVSPDLPATYQVLVTDANGCTDTENITVDTYLPPVPIAGNDETVCPGTVVQLNEFVYGGTQPYVSTWTDIDNGVVLTSTSVTPLIPNGTTYELSVQDANGCIGTDEVVISLFDQPVAQIQPDFVLPLCSGSVATLNGSEANGVGVSQYSWTIGLPNNPVVGNLPQFDFVGTGSNETVFLTLTDINGCQDSESIFIQTGTTPVVNIPNQNVNVCDGSVATLAVLPNPANSQVTWVGNGIVGSASQSVISVEPDLGGLCQSQTFQYDVSVNNNGCVTNEVVLVTVYPTPSVTSSQETFCGNIDETLCIYSSCGTGNVDYQWSIGNSVLSNSQCYTVNLNENTNFTISAIDEMGCTSSGTFEVTILEVPQLVTSISDNSICENDPVNLLGSVVVGTGQSPYTVQWINDASGATLSNSNTVTVNPSVSNSYTYQVTDFNGCVNSSTESVTVNPNPTFVLDDLFLCSGASGFLTIVPPAGSQYGYLWSPTTSTIGSITAGALEIIPQVNNGNTLTQLDYNVVVTDQFTGCISNDSASVFVWPQPVISISGPPITDILCYQEEALLISNVTQGQYPWVISWEALNGLESGIGNTFLIHPTETVVYEATVTDNQGCTGSDTYQVNVFDTNNLQVFAGDDVGVCLDSQTTVQVNGVYANGVPPLSVEWTYAGNPLIQSTTNTWDVPADYNGVLVFEVTDGNGCVFQDELNFVALNPQAEISVGATTGCSPFSVNLGANGGTTYTWTFCDGLSSNESILTYDFVNSSTTEILNCTIELTAFLQQGSLVCENTTYQTITVNPTPIADFQLPGATICDQEEIFVTDLSSGAESYQWVLNGTPLPPNLNVPEPNFGVTLPGNYILEQIVSNGYGCSDSITNTINVLAGPDPNFTFVVPTPCIPSPVQFTDETQSPVGIIGYEWNFGDGQSSFVQNPIHIYDEPGTYDVTLTVYSANGCSVDITQPSAFSFGQLPDVSNVEFTVTPQIESEYNTAFDFAINNPDLSLDYSWSFGDNNYGYGVNTSNNYEYVGFFNVEVTATDLIGCQTTIDQTIMVDDPLNVFVPNAFTPDQNNLNEVFIPVIRGKQSISSYMFEIYDRWGNKVFETDDMFKGWNGTINVREGRENFYFFSPYGGDFSYSNGTHLCQNDQYIWRIVIETFNDGGKEFKGSVMLIR
jgi:gliding motility-associated-like protein